MKMQYHILAALSLLLLTSPALPQSKETGEVRGSIVDSTGAVVPGVKVVATNTSTRLASETNSNDTGTYVLPLLPPGAYKVSFEKTGFKSVVQSGINLQVGSAVRLDAQLEVGAVSDSIEVSATAAQVNMETSDRANRITSEALMELPILGTDRDSTSLMKLAPGTTFDTNGVNGQLNGMSGVATTWMFNGGQSTFAQSWNIDLTRPNPEAIAEVTFENTNFSAEYANAGAVYNIITKSGTNKFHGTVHEYLQNDKIAARNFFARTKPPLRWNEFGGNIGGPIKKDKMFAFFNYKGLRLRNPAVVITTVPTVAEKAGDFSAPGLPSIFDPASTQVVNGRPVRQPFANNIIPANRIDQVAAKVMPYWPSPNQSGLVNNYYNPGGSTNNWDQFTWKFDWQVNPAHRLSASAMLNQQNRMDNLPIIPLPACMNDCTRVDKTAWQGGLSDVWTVRPNLLNEFRLSYTYETVRRGAWPSLGLGIPAKLGLPTMAADVFPDISTGGTIGYSIQHGNAGFDLRQSIPVPADTVTWIKGRHIFKTGFQFVRSQVSNAQPWTAGGSFSFNGTFSSTSTVSGSGLGFADFALGVPTGWSVNMAPDLGVRNSALETFIQDDFKVRPNLTINIGVRHWGHTGWSEVNNRLSTFDPTLMNQAAGRPGAIRFAGINGPSALTDSKWAQMAPRAGFAWSPLKNFSLRGAYGIFFFPFEAIDYSNQNPAGFSINRSLSTTDNLTPVFQLSSGPPAVSWPSRDSLTPSILNNQSFQYWPTKLSDAYSQQFHLTVERQIRGVIVDVGYVGNIGTHLQYQRNINQVPQSLWGPGDTQPRTPYPQYLGINGVFNDGKSKYNSLQVQAKKSFSNGLLFGTAYTWAKCTDDLSTPVSSNTALWHGACAINRTQRFVGHYVYELPVGKGKHLLNRGGIADAVVGGWQLSGIFQAESGAPLTPSLAITNPGGGGPWIPNRVGDGNLSSDQRDRLHWFDASAFSAPAPYTMGNMGRNIITGPGLWILDFSLAKGFRMPFLGEKGKLQYRADMSNVMNHTNFGNPNTAIGSSAVGTITSAREPRKIQMGLRLDF